MVMLSISLTLINSNYCRALLVRANIACSSGPCRAPPGYGSGVRAPGDGEPAPLSFLPFSLPTAERQDNTKLAQNNNGDQHVDYL